MNRFIRLDTMWSASEWISTLSAEARLVWVELLCYVKNAGRDGKAKALHPEIAARMWFLGAESVRQLLIAAERHGALRVEGSNWVVVKWAAYQGDPTNAERQSRFRERQVTPSNALRNARNTEKEKEKEKDTEREPPKPPKGGSTLSGLNGVVPESLEPIRSLIEEFVAHRKHMGKAKALTPEAIRRQILRFERWGPDVAKAQIEQCIERGWMAPIEPEIPAQDDRTRILEKLRAEGYE